VELQHGQILPQLPAASLSNFLPAGVLSFNRHAAAGLTKVDEYLAARNHADRTGATCVADSEPAMSQRADPGRTALLNNDS
jgi:hypothetical protein